MFVNKLLASLAVCVELISWQNNKLKAQPANTLVFNHLILLGYEMKLFSTVLVKLTAVCKYQKARKGIKLTRCNCNFLKADFILIMVGFTEIENKITRKRRNIRRPTIFKT